MVSELLATGTCCTGRNAQWFRSSSVIGGSVYSAGSSTAPRRWTAQHRIPVNQPVKILTVGDLDSRHVTLCVFLNVLARMDTLGTRKPRNVSKNVPPRRKIPLSLTALLAVLGMNAVQSAKKLVKLLDLISARGSVSKNAPVIKGTSWTKSVENV